jgi:murein DD-endopeptidase MepM/ murein hydrolase activator NlpD
LQDNRAFAWPCACALALCALIAAPTAAATGQPPGMGGGGVTYVATPKITAVSCLRACASKKRARAGSTLRITGTALSGVTEVTFHGSYGSSDNVSVRVRAGSDVRLHARVPAGAATGPISATSAAGARSRRTKPLAILPPPPPEPNPVLSPVPGPVASGAPLLETGTSRTKAFVGARRAVTFSFRLSGTAPAALTVELVRAADGLAVKSWAPQGVVPGQVTSVSWNGLIDRVPAALGRYSFRLTAAAADGSRATSAQTGAIQRDAFDLYDHVFPVRGRHNYGGSGSGFGSGRAGHSHQGHDVFAKCGVRLVAARGGRVQYSGYHGAAGNYLVIDGAGSDLDYAYMHLAEPSPFRAGDRVYTGQRIGSVGETGNARGCHLHFELWGAPGWYDGGSPFDPLPSLQAWDSWS